MTSNARLERELEVAKALAKKPPKPKYPTYQQDTKTSLHGCLWCGTVINNGYIHNQGKGPWNTGYASTFAALEQHVTTQHVNPWTW